MISSKNNEISSHWLLGVVSGVFSTLIGWFLLTSPAITVVTLVQVLGFYWIIVGVIDIISSIFGSAKNGRGWEFFSGVLGIIAGMIILNSPIMSSIVTTMFLVYLIGFIFIFNGIARIFVEDKAKSGLILRLIAGGFSILIGFVMLGNVLFTAKFFIALIGILTVMGGVVTIITSFMLRGGKK